MLGNVNKIAVVDQVFDMRKGMNFMLSIAYESGLDPLKGDILIVGSRDRKKIKVLHGDTTGIWLSIKLYTTEDVKHGLNFLNIGTKHISKNELIGLLKGCISKNKIMK